MGRAQGARARGVAHRPGHLRRAGLVVMCLAMLSAFGVRHGLAESEPVAAVAVRIQAEPERTRFVTDLTRTVAFKVYVLPDPYRVIIDLPGIDFRLPGDSGATVSGLVTGYRYGSLDLGRSRIVMDAAGPVLIERSFILHPRDGEPARLIVDLVATDAETFTRLHRSEQLSLAEGGAHAGDVPTELAPISIGPPPSLTHAPQSSSDSVPRPRPKPGSEVALSDVSPPPGKPVKSRPVVVIDPGHGGIDPGAVSRSGTTEKHVVREFSEVLKQALEAAGGYDVHLTRSDDVFLSLSDRVQFARRHNADLFIAIHADSLRRGTARGATVYTLADKASDAEAAALAHKENRSDIIAGVDLVAESEQITGILIDLAQREAKNHATIFAKQLVGELKPVAKLNSRPLRSAGFRVLMAPDVPSVLFELGYLSNRNDETLLLSPEWRTGVAAAMAAAIERYFATQLAAGQ